MTTGGLGFLLGLGAAGLGAVAAGNAVGFRSQRPSHMAALGPKFDIRERLNGPMDCDGVIFGPMGRVSARFVAQFHGAWDGDTGTLTESFRYDSGTEQNRAWRLTLGSGGAIRAEAEDLIGPGRGMQRGAAVQLIYRIRMPEGAGGHVLDVTDWMYLLENGTIMNRSQFRKWGIKVAELMATIRARD
jgi:hypothetical protein